MLTNNSNTSSSALPPPPPLPLGGLKNWTLPQDNGNSKKPSNVATSGISSRTEPKKGQSNSPVRQSHLNLEKSPLFNKIQQKNNVDSETADEGSNIRQSEPNRRSTPESVSSRVLSPQQDNGNSNKPSGINNSTQSEKGLSENPIQLATEQKIDTPILVNTSVGISKATALKYSIATLLLCISSVTAGIYTYLSISVTLSDPVLFTVIASVSSLVVLSLAAYLINSHLSAINSEKKVDPGRKQSQYSELQKEAESLGHSNTPIPSLEMSGTPSAPPPRPTPSKCTEKPKNGAPKKANESEHDRSALLEQIRTGGVKLKRVNNKVENAKIPDNNKNPQPKDLMTDLTKALQKRRNGIAKEEENSVEMSDVFCARISSMIPPPKNQSSSSSSNNSDESWDTDDEHSILPTPQSDGEKRSESPDSSHVTTPPRSALKVENDLTQKK